MRITMLATWFYSLLTLAASPSIEERLEPNAIPRPELDPLNAVVIVVDDIGHDLIGAYSRRYPCSECPTGTVPDPCTPNLDSLAASGALFTNAWSTPMCSPTRAQIMTGKRARDLGVGFVTLPLSSRPGLDPDEFTIGDMFPVAAAVGKWHLAEQENDYGHPLECGFQSFSGTFWNLTPPPQDGPGYTNWLSYDGSSPPVRRFDDATVATTDDALAQLATLNTVTSPWLLYVAYNSIHVPLECPVPPHPGTFPCTTDWWAECDSTCTRNNSTCRGYAMVQQLDYEIGRILAAIDDTDTAVILVSDNGTAGHIKNPPFVNGFKQSMYQGGVNVPFIMRTPNTVPGTEVHELVHVSDIFATLADLGRLPVPAGVTGLDSVSLAQYVEPDYAHPEAKPRSHVYAEAFSPNFYVTGGTSPPGYGAVYHLRAIRDDRFKLIERLTLAGVEHEFYVLFDPSPGAPPLPHDPAISADPHEVANLMLTQASWSPALHAAYEALNAELNNNYPALTIQR